MTSDSDTLGPRHEKPAVPVARQSDLPLTGSTGSDEPGRPVSAEQADTPAALTRGDNAARARTMGQLQQQHGNAFVQRVVQLHIRQRGAAVQRDTDDAVPMDTSTAPSPAQETVGPVSESSYKVSATSLADAADEIESRDEAAHVDYAPKFDLKQVDGKVTEVTLDVQITMEMPEWTPPKDMGPKAKAEWARALAALRAHEDGHVKLVHKYFDGLAKKMLGKSEAKAKELFTTAKSGLDKATKDYDKTTDHGKKTGTVIDVSIEETEKKELEAAKAKAGDKK